MHLTRCPRYAVAQGNKKLNEDDYPRGLDLRTEDFAWLTEQLMGVANLCCEGRIVSVLEVRGLIQIMVLQSIVSCLLRALLLDDPPMALPCDVLCSDLDIHRPS